MKGLFKFLGLAVGALVLLLVVAAIWLFFIFDPNDFKQTLSDQVACLLYTSDAADEYQRV